MTAVSVLWDLYEWYGNPLAGTYGEGWEKVLDCGGGDTMFPLEWSACGGVIFAAGGTEGQVGHHAGYSYFGLFKDTQPSGAHWQGIRGDVWHNPDPAAPAPVKETGIEVGWWGDPFKTPKYIPAADPHAIPPGLPTPDPSPIPHRAIPGRTTNPNRAEQTDRGPAATPRVTPFPLRVAARRPPERRVHERKMKGTRGIVNGLAKVYTGGTEALDMLDAIHKALPKEFRHGTGGKNADGTWKHSVATEAFLKAKDIYKHYDKLDAAEAMYNVVKNGLEDLAIGGAQKGWAKGVSKVTGSTHGVGLDRTGPVNFMFPGK